MVWDCLSAPEFLHKMTQLSNVSQSWSSSSSACCSWPVSLEQTRFNLSMFLKPDIHNLRILESDQVSEVFFQVRSQVCTCQKGKIEAKKMQLN